MPSAHSVGSVLSPRGGLPPAPLSPAAAVLTNAHGWSSVAEQLELSVIPIATVSNTTSLGGATKHPVASSWVITSFSAYESSRQSGDLTRVHPM